MDVIKVLLIGMILLPLSAGAKECGDGETRQRMAWKAAVDANPDTLIPHYYAYRELQTGGGYAYLFYVNTNPKREHAQSLLVVMDRSCGIRFVENGTQESNIVVTADTAGDAERF